MKNSRLKKYLVILLGVFMMMTLFSQIKRVNAEEGTLKIHFDANGGTGEMQDEVIEGTSYTLPECGFGAPEGMVFTGWKFNDELILKPKDVITVSGTGTINCTAQWEVIVSLNSISIKQGTEMTVNKGATGLLTVLYDPSDTNEQAVEWSSSNTEVVTVSQTGYVEAKNFGEATITATSKIHPEISASILMRVRIPAQKVTAEKNMTLNFDTGEVKNVNAVVTPSDTTDTLTYSSEDESIATVDENGNVTPHKVGITRITSQAGQASTKTSVTVSTNYYTISFDANGGGGSMEPVTLPKGDTYLIPECGFTAPAGKSFNCWKINDTEDTVTYGYELSSTGNIKLTAQWVDRIQVSSVTLNKNSLTLDKGKAETLQANVLPEEATNKKVTWTSSNTSVATVDSNGKVTAKSNGTTTITAASQEDPTKKATCTVTVVIPVESITAASSLTLNLDTNEKKNVNASVSPSNATDKTISYKSSNTSIATVDSTGKVTPKKSGLVTITSTSSNGKVARTTVSVVSEYYYISFDANGGTGTMEKLKVKKSPQDNPIYFTVPECGFTPPAGKAFDTWKWQNVDRAVKPGQGAWSSADNTLVAQWKNEVKPTSVKLNKSTLTLVIDKSENLVATISPSDATDKKLTWTSSDKSVATVSTSGKVTAKKVGTTTITVKTSNGKTATCKVTVTKAPVGINYLNVSPTNVQVTVGKTTTIKAIIQPDNATNKKIVWTTGNKNIATVDSNGKVKGVNAGIVYITASTEDDSFQASAIVQVVLPKVQAVAVYNSAHGADIRWKPVEGVRYYGIWRKRTNPVTKILEEKIVMVIDANTYTTKEGGNFKWIDPYLKDKYTDKGKEWEGGWVYYVTARSTADTSQQYNDGLHLMVDGPISNKLNLYRLRNPEIKTATAAGSGKIKLTWSKVTNAHSYEVSYTSDGGKTWTKVPQVEGENNTSVTVSGLTNGTKYNFRIRCQKTNASLGTTWSEYSPWKSATPKK